MLKSLLRGVAPHPLGSSAGFLAQTSARQLEHFVMSRPRVRDQGIWDMRLVQYVHDLDASFHAGYRFFIDGWGISAHTFDLDWVQPVEGWVVTPRFRYYSQEAADFYQPYFLFSGPAPTVDRPGGIGEFNLAGVPLSAYSSDYRLSAYGAISTGLTVAKQFGKAVGFEAGFEYYTHAGNLRMGGAGEGDWASFQYYQFNAAVKVDVSAVSMASLGEEDSQAHHHHDGAESIYRPLSLGPWSSGE